VVVCDDDDVKQSKSGGEIGTRLRRESMSEQEFRVQPSPVLASSRQAVDGSTTLLQSVKTEYTARKAKFIITITSCCSAF
jgi:hypothetical protein